MSMQVPMLLASAAIALLCGLVLGKWAYRALYRMTMFARISLRERTVLRLEGPIAVLVGVAAWALATNLFALDLDMLAFARTTASIGLLLGLAWLALRVVDAWIEAIAVSSEWISGHRVSQSLLPAGRRVARGVVGVIACVMILAVLGYSVGALVVALAVAGIAIALGARKVLEDVFGAFAIGVDHPFREGDFIKLTDGTLGAVEDIGLRSTRIRTLDRTLVTIPNGRLADAQIEALTERDRMRFDVKLKVELGATTHQLEHVLQGLRDLLRAQPQHSPEQPSVHLVAITDSYFELEAMAWFRATWSEFEAIRDRLLISCLEVVGRAGLRLHNAPNPPIAETTVTARQIPTQPWPIGEPDARTTAH
jgi:MscS family membrane protein